MEQKNDLQQTAAVTRHFHEPVEPHSSFHPSALLLVIVAVFAFTLAIVGIVVDHQQAADAGVLIAQILFVIAIALVGVGIPGAIGYYLWHRSKLDRIKRDHAALDLKAKEEQMEREKEEHEMRMYLAESRLHPDERGNRPFVFDRHTGQVLTVESGNFVQNVPHTYSPHISTSSSTHVTEEDQQQKLLPAAAAVQPPTIEGIIAQLPYNELMTAYGVTLAGGKLITASIPESVHFKLVGGSGFGKSCEAAALLRIATLCNDADHLQIALLDLEHKTSQLFENLPHVATIHVGRKAVDMAMEGPSADEVAHKLAALVYELQRRASKGIETPILLIYVEEMLSLRYEVDAALLDSMLAHLAILAVRGRKYGMFLEACTQADYSTQELRVAQKQFRSRIAFAVDPTAARASGFNNTQLIKTNFQAGQPGQFVLEKPGFADILIAPQLDVKQELKRLEVPTSGRQTTHFHQAEVPTSGRPDLHVVDRPGSTGGKWAEVGFSDEDTARSNEPLSEKAQNVAAMLRQRKGQNEIIQELWGVSGGRAYQAATDEYRDIVAQILERGA